MAICDSFNERTLANLEVALERACHALGSDGMSHDNRKFVALMMITAAKDGATTLAQLNTVAKGAVELLAKRKHRDAASGDAEAAPQRRPLRKSDQCTWKSADPIPACSAGSTAPPD